MLLFYGVKKQLYYIFLLNTIGVFSQALLKGEITNSNDIDGIHVFNKTFQKYTITTEEGRFSIPVRPQDTIVFTALQYHLKEVIVTEEIFNDEVIQVLLDTKVNELDEVYIGYELTGNLITDSKQIKTTQSVEFGMTDAFRGLGDYKGVLVKDEYSEIGENEMPSGINIIGLILSLIPKNKTVIKKVIPLKYSKDDLELYFGKQFMLIELNLNEHDCERFIQFTEFDEQLIMTLNNRDKFALVNRLLELRKTFITLE